MEREISAFTCPICDRKLYEDELAEAAIHASQGHINGLVHVDAQGRPFHAVPGLTIIVEEQKQEGKTR